MLSLMTNSEKKFISWLFLRNKLSSYCPKCINCDKPDILMNIGSKSLGGPLHTMYIIDYKIYECVTYMSSINNVYENKWYRYERSI